MEKENFQYAEIYQISEDDILSEIYLQFYMNSLAKKQKKVKKQKNVISFSYSEDFSNNKTAKDKKLEKNKFNFGYYCLVLFFFLYSSPLFLLISKMTGFGLVNPAPLFTPGVAIAYASDSWDARDYVLSTNPVVDSWDARDYVLSTNPVLEIAVLPDSLHMRITDSNVSSKQSGRVIAAGLQPKTHQMASRGAMGFSRPATLYTRKTFFMSIPQRRTFVGAAIHNNNIYAVAVQVYNNLEITKQYNVTNLAISNVEKNFGEICTLVAEDARLASLNKVLNVQEWQATKKGKPILVFNLDSTQGIYKKNAKATKFVKEILTYYVEQNPNLQFEIEYRQAEAEHPNQKVQLESLMMSQKDGATYLLDKEAHGAKTSNIDLKMKPDTKTIVKWFTDNGDRTIEYLQTLWDAGKLSNSVEKFESFDKAIRACVQQDLNTFYQTGLVNTDIHFPGQIRASTVGRNDCQSFMRHIYHNQHDDLDPAKIRDSALGFIQKSHVRAAYIHNGMHVFPMSSVAHRTQEFESTYFLESYNKLMICLKDEFPSVMQDSKIQKALSDFHNILNGQGRYTKITTGEAYKKYLKDLDDPKAHVTMFPRTSDCRHDHLIGTD